MKRAGCSNKAKTKNELLQITTLQPTHTQKQSKKKPIKAKQLHQERQDPI